MIGKRVGFWTNKYHKSYNSGEGEILDKITDVESKVGHSDPNRDGSRDVALTFGITYYMVVDKHGKIFRVKPKQITHIITT